MRKASKWLAIMMAIIMLTSVGLVGCGGEEAPQGDNTEGNQASGGEQVFQFMTSDEPLLDPQLAQYASSLEIMNNIYEGLLRVGPDQEFQPAMAKEMPEVSEDGLVYTFKLRDANWSDGSPVTADDFVYGLKRAVNPDLGSIYAFIVGDYVKEAKALDEKTLEITMKKPVPYFNSLASFGTWFPVKKEFVEKHGEQFGREQEAMLFNGPFKVTEWNHDQQLTLEKNENYWDKDTVKLDKVTIQIIKDDNAALNLYLSDQLDYVRLGAENVELYKNDEGFMSYAEPVLFYFLFNQENEVLQNVHIRRAINFGLNRQQLVDVVLKNGSVPANGYVPQGIPGPEDQTFREANGDIVKYNVEKAKEELALGLEDLGIDKLPTLRLLSYDTSSTALKTSEFLKETFRTIGIDFEVENLPVAAVKEKRKSGDFDLFMGGWGPDYWDPMTFLDLWVTGGTFNEGKYSNKKFDELIEFAKTTNDFDARMEKLLEAEKIMLQEDPALAPIYFRGRSLLVRPAINDFVIHKFGADTSWKWMSFE